VNRTIALLLLAACGENGPTAPPPDDGMPAPTGRTLTGSHVIAYRGLDQTLLSEETFDMWDTRVEAQVPDGDGWTIVGGVGHRDGSFDIDGLPDGPVWLRFAERPAGQDFYWTDAEHMSFDEIVLGPSNPPRSDENDHLDLAVDGLDPWQDGDQLAWFVPGQVVFENDATISAPPAAGTTDLGGLAVPWSGRPLADVGPSTPAFLVQYRLQTFAPGIQLLSPLRAGHPTIHQVAGTDNTLATTVAAPPALDYHLAIARDEFEALRTEVHPHNAGASDSHNFGMTAYPTLVDGTLWVGEEYPVLQVWDPAFLDGTAPLDAGVLSIPNPYPREWLTDQYVSTFPVSLPLPDGSPRTLEASIGTRRTDFTGPLEPAITPLRAPTIAGRDLFTNTTGVGLTPQLAWQPPRIGTPTAYQIQIIEANANPPPPFRPGWYITGNLYVPGDVTSVRVPANMLHTGTTYAIIARTIAQPGMDVRTWPTRTGAVAAFADAITGTFTP
jgi:hypothetical protein